MGDNLPKLARTVAVGSTFYVDGETPPVEHARKITNPKNWRGGVVPDFDSYLVDDEDAAEGARNGNAAQTSGLPGPNGTAEGAAAGAAGDGGQGAGPDDGQGAGPDGGQGAGPDDEQGGGGGGHTTPVKAAPRKSAKSAH